MAGVHRPRKGAPVPSLGVHSPTPPRSCLRGFPRGWRRGREAGAKVRGGGPLLPAQGPPPCPLLRPQPPPPPRRGSAPGGLGGPGKTPGALGRRRAPPPRPLPVRAPGGRRSARSPPARPPARASPAAQPGPALRRLLAAHRSARQPRGPRRPSPAPPSPGPGPAAGRGRVLAPTMRAELWLLVLLLREAARALSPPPGAGRTGRSWSAWAGGGEGAGRRPWAPASTHGPAMSGWWGDCPRRAGSSVGCGRWTGTHFLKHIGCVSEGGGIRPRRSPPPPLLPSWKDTGGTPVEGAT